MISRDYVRLNAKNLTDIHELFVECMYDKFKVIVDIPELKTGIFKLRQVCNYHSAPIGKKTNFGGVNKNYPTSFIGWELINTRGTYRDINGNKLSDKFLRNFDTIRSLSWFNGINTGTFNGGDNFMGCFRFFIDDFPFIKENMIDLFDKNNIMDVYKIDNWTSHVRKIKLKKLDNIYINE